MKKANFVIAVIITLALNTSWAYAGRYSWIDKDGVRHSSDQPPSEYMKQKTKASQQADDELPPEVTQTLFNPKRKYVVPDINANQIPPAPDDEIKQTVKSPPEYEYPETKQKTTSPPKDKNTIPLKPKVIETHKKRAVPPPAQTLKPMPVSPKPVSKERISFYQNQLVRLKELIKSQEELIAEDVRTIGLIENRINQIKHTQGPKSDRLKNELKQSKKSLIAAKNRLKSDVRELQFLQSNVNNYQFKLKSAR